MREFFNVTQKFSGVDVAELLEMLRVVRVFLSLSSCLRDVDLRMP